MSVNAKMACKPITYAKTNIQTQANAPSKPLTSPSAASASSPENRLPSKKKTDETDGFLPNSTLSGNKRIVPFNESQKKLLFQFRDPETNVKESSEMKCNGLLFCSMNHHNNLNSGEPFPLNHQCSLGTNADVAARYVRRSCMTPQESVQALRDQGLHIHGNVQEAGSAMLASFVLANSSADTFNN